MLKRRGRPRYPDTEAIEYGGYVFTRRPGKKYFECNKWDKERKRQWTDSLHRAIWRNTYGEIPDRHDIHHKDEDYNNNAIENLECIPKSDHARLHNRFAAFNGTAESREHHKRLTALIWANAKYKTYTCGECGKAFESRRINLPPKFCSKNCCGNHNRRIRRARVRLAS
jgi:hypothetical protein